MALNKISLGMLEKKVLMDTSVTNGVMKMFWSDGTVSTYTPPAGQAVDLSNYYTKAEADSRFLTKAQADQLYAPLGSGGGTTSGLANVWEAKANGLTRVQTGTNGLGQPVYVWRGWLRTNFGQGIYRIDYTAVGGDIISPTQTGVSLIVFVGDAGFNGQTSYLSYGSSSMSGDGQVVTGTYRDPNKFCMYTTDFVELANVYEWQVAVPVALYKLK